MSSTRILKLFACALCSLLVLVHPHDARAGDLSLLGHLQDDPAEKVVLMVNGDPIFARDLADRQHFLALTSGLASKIRVAMKSEDTKKAYREFMTKANPASKAEAEELQRKFLARIQQTVVNEASRGMRQKALDELIKEQLMLQAARNLEIGITNEEVDELLVRLAQTGNQKQSLAEFTGLLKQQGIESTVKRRIAAQIAWRKVIQQVYGAKVQATIAARAKTGQKETNMLQAEFQLYARRHLKDLKDHARLDYPKNG